MRSKYFLPATLGLLLALGSPAQGQGDLPAEDTKGSKGSAPSPDDILEQMGGGPPAGAEGEPAVDADANPALLEEGQFEAGRDIFENIFRGPGSKDGGPVAEGLPGMRIEEVTLSGVMTGAFGTVALFLAKDKQIYAARENQKFSNGRLANIAKDKVVFEQEVIDEFGKKRPPIIKEVLLHRNDKKKGRGQ